MVTWKSPPLRFVLAAAAILVLSLVLSQQEGTSPAAARARSITVEERLPFDVTIPGPAPCIQEDIHVQGTIHLVFHITFGSNGSIRVTLAHIDISGTGVGLTTGTKYRVSGAARATLTSNGSQFEYTITGRQFFIAQGGAPSFYLQFVGHTTVNAKGEVTTSFFNFRITCRPELPASTATPTNNPYPPPGTPTPTFNPYPPPGTPTPTFNPYPPPGTPTPTFNPYPPPGTPTPTFNPYPPPGTPTPTFNPYPPPGTPTPTFNPYP